MEPLPDAPANITSLLDALWERKQPLLLEKLAVLERAVAAGDHLDSALRQQAAGEAHKLAGVLGTFGLPEGTTLARALEEGLEAGDLSPRQMAELLCFLRRSILARATRPI